MGSYSSLPRPVKDPLEASIGVQSCSSEQDKDMGLSVATADTRDYSIFSPVPWASYQICKIAGAHAPGMPGTFFPPPQVSNPDMSISWKLDRLLCNDAADLRDQWYILRVKWANGYISEKFKSNTLIDQGSMLMIERDMDYSEQNTTSNYSEQHAEYSEQYVNFSE